MHNAFGLAAGLLSGLAHLLYLIAIFRSNTKPERASWLLWTVLGTISFFSQLAAGASSSLWLVGVQASSDLLIFIAALRYGLGGLAIRDLAGLGLAGAGLYIWYVTHNPAYALIISVAIGAIASTLTIIKVLQRPGTESRPFFVLILLAGVSGGLAVGRFDPVLLLYPAYLVAVNIAILVAIQVSTHRRRPHARRRHA